jgi:hypothetical protein
VRRIPLFSLVLILIFAGTWWIRVGRHPRPTGSFAVPACDSANAARVAIDSLSRVERFRSRVFRFQADSQGMRIVTIPDTTSTVTDGMAVIHVNRRCRITSLVQADSA